MSCSYPVLRRHPCSCPCPIPRLAEEEEAKRQAAEAKKQREADKKALKRERQRLRALVEGGGGSNGRLLDEDDTEKLCQGLDTAALAAVCDAASAEGLSAEQQRAVLVARLDEMRRAEEGATAERERQKKEAAAALQVGTCRISVGLPWPLMLPRVATARPVGCLCCRQQHHDVAAKTLSCLVTADDTLCPLFPPPLPPPKDIAKRDHVRKMASMSAWTDEELRLLDKATKKFPMGTPKR
jgi:hypothetical protein